MSDSRFLLALVAAIVIAPAAYAAPVIGQMNTFEGGSTLGWSNGGGAADPTLQTGGPAGAADHYLQVLAKGGSGSGSRIVTYNRSAGWSGDWATSGIVAVEMDLLNPNTFPLHVRIGVDKGNANAAGLVSTLEFTLPADNQWHHGIFPIGSADLTALSGGNYATVMAGVTEMRILSSSSLSLHGDAISARLGIDNIRAVGVPEPTSAAMVLSAGVFALRRRRQTA